MWRRANASDTEAVAASAVFEGASRAVVVVAVVVSVFGVVESMGAILWGLSHQPPICAPSVGLPEIVIPSADTGFDASLQKLIERVAVLFA
jgi:hypothetical protein